MNNNKIDFLKEISLDLFDFVISCLKLNYKNRINAKMLLAHKYFDEIRESFPKELDNLIALDNYENENADFNNNRKIPNERIEKILVSNRIKKNNFKSVLSRLPNDLYAQKNRKPNPKYNFHELKIKTNLPYIQPSNFNDDVRMKINNNPVIDNVVYKYLKHNITNRNTNQKVIDLNNSISQDNLVSCCEKNIASYMSIDKVINPSQLLRTNRIKEKSNKASNKKLKEISHWGSTFNNNEFPKYQIKPEGTKKEKENDNRKTQGKLMELQNPNCKEECKKCNVNKSPDFQKVSICRSIDNAR